MGVSYSDLGVMLKVWSFAEKGAGGAGGFRKISLAEAQGARRADNVCGVRSERSSRF